MVGNSSTVESPIDLQSHSMTCSSAYSDNDEDDCGPMPSELYGRFTWRFDNFDRIKTREARSNSFDIGGHKWYILIYPQGLELSDTLSVFLCVGNRDKLLPGWNHFAQFTIAVINRNPYKSKYSDTLHRFWKKEPDWGWKRFMELSKLHDGFIDEDVLTIKVQVQVIREKVDCLFRCLDGQYRRELVRVYLSNLKQIHWRFIKERRSKFCGLIDDRLRWSSFNTFWLGMDAGVRQHMMREKTDIIFKILVRHFFVEHEVTSTLIMDSLYTGLKTIEYQSKNKKAASKLIETDAQSTSMVLVEQDMFTLADDLILLLERASLVSLSEQPLSTTDDKSLQNSTKGGGPGDDSNKDSIDRDDRQLVELSCKTLEIFVLSFITSGIEVAYEESVALKREEELIGKEEVAGVAGIDLKAKCSAAEKETTHQ